MTPGPVESPPRQTWLLTSRQWEIFTARERFLVLVAGRRFGKTVLALLWLITEVRKREENALAYYTAPFRVMARAIAWDLLLLLTRGIRVAANISDLSVTLVGGRKIVLKGADDPETLEGVGLVAVVLDEFGKMKLAAWEKSIRPALADRNGRALICGKPRGHNHLKEFYDRGQSAAMEFTDWRSWIYTTAQGGFVPALDIAEAKRTLPARVFRQEFESTFEALAGRVYDEFTQRTHVVPHAEIERDYRVGQRWNFPRIAVGVDWGTVSPGVMLAVGRTGTGRLVVLGEHYEAGVLVSEMGWLRIAREFRSKFHPERFAADPSEPGNLQALRLALGGNPVVENAQNAVAEGIRRVSIKMLLREDRKPGLLISDACPNLIRELEGYVWKEVAGHAIEQPADVDDHACDALRYATMSLTQNERTA